MDWSRLSLSAAAQEPPRTGWGDPDLQGVWDFRTLTPLERPEDLGDKTFLTAEEATEREQAEFDRNLELWEQARRETVAGGNVGGYNNFWMDRGSTVIETRRTSLVIDPPNGRLPALTEEGQARADIPLGSFAVEFPETYTDLSTYDRCILGFNAGSSDHPGRLQPERADLPDAEAPRPADRNGAHGSRHPAGRPAALSTSRVQQWSGDSRGRWEGDTLVVETRRTSRRSGPGARSSERMTLVERFRRLDDDTLEYEYTVTDPGTWTAPWTVNLPMAKSDLPLFEYACHEGNYSMINILGGARALEGQADGR